jgi:hypothetical protein
MKHSLLYTMLLCSAAPAAAQISVSIGINVPTYPRCSASRATRCTTRRA